MLVAFVLGMPNCPSWNGKWSGVGRRYVLVRTFRGRDVPNAQTIVSHRHYHYSWPDGWGASITATEVTPAEAKKLRKESHGFCGYDWMVDSIIRYGKPLAIHEIDAHLAQLQSINTMDNLPVPLVDAEHPPVDSANGGRPY